MPRQLCTHEQAASLRDTYSPQHSSHKASSSVPFGTLCFSTGTGVRGHKNQHLFETPFFTPEVHLTSKGWSLAETVVHPRTSSIPSGHIFAAAQLSPSEHSQAAKQLSTFVLQPLPSPSVQIWLWRLPRPKLVSESKSPPGLPLTIAAPFFLHGAAFSELP